MFTASFLTQSHRAATGDNASTTSRMFHHRAIQRHARAYNAATVRQDAAPELATADEIIPVTVTAAVVITNPEIPSADECSSPMLVTRVAVGPTEIAADDETHPTQVIDFSHADRDTEVPSSAKSRNWGAEPEKEVRSRHGELASQIVPASNASVTISKVTAAAQVPAVPPADEFTAMPVTAISVPLVETGQNDMVPAPKKKSRKRSTKTENVGIGGIAKPKKPRRKRREVKSLAGTADGTNAHALAGISDADSPP